MLCDLIKNLIIQLVQDHDPHFKYWQRTVVRCKPVFYHVGQQNESKADTVLIT